MNTLESCQNQLFSQQQSSLGTHIPPSNNNPQAAQNKQHRILEHNYQSQVSNNDQSKKQSKISSQYLLYSQIKPIVSNSQVSVKFCKENLIGKGAYAAVYLCYFFQSQSSDEKPLKLALKSLKPDVRDNKVEVAGFLLEAFILSNINHENIVKFYGMGLQQPNSLRSSYYLLEYLRGGSLKNLLLLQKLQRQQDSGYQLYSRHDALRWCINIARAIKYLHQFEVPVAHRDIKLDNILLSDRNPSKAIAKLADFGLARFLVPSKRSSAGKQGEIQVDKDQKYYNLTGQSGSLMYMAPEVFLNEAYNEKADIFSLGIVMLEIFSGNISSQTFLKQQTWSEAKSHAQKVSQGYRVQLPSYIDSKIRYVIASSQNQDPSQRPSAGQVLEYLEQVQVQWDNEYVLRQSPFETQNGLERKLSVGQSIKDLPQRIMRSLKRHWTV